MKIEYINNCKTLKFSHFVVRQVREDFNGIYFLADGRLLIHKKTWKQATKIAQLLEESYKTGYCDGYTEALDNQD